MGYSLSDFGAKLFKLAARHWKRLAVNITVFVGLVVASTRVYLGSGGFLIFQNWTWPIAYPDAVGVQSTFSPTGWTPTGPDPIGFSRSWISWPVLISSELGLSSPQVELFFICYAFGVAFLLCQLAARLFTRYVGVATGTQGGMFLEVLVIILFFINPAALQWEAGLAFPFLWGAPMLTAAWLCVLLGLRSNDFRFELISGLLTGAAATMDPRLFVWGLLGTTLIVGGVILSRRKSVVIVRYLVILGSSLPGALYTYFAYEWSGTSLGAIRSASAQSIAFFSGNSSPSQVFELMGYWWSSITYAPPSILGAGNLSALSTVGQPPYALADPGLIQVIWLLSLGTLPLLAFLSLLLKGTKTLALPFGGLSLAFLALAMGSQMTIPNLVYAEALLFELPGIGSIAQVVFGVPIYVQVATEACYIPLICLSIPCVVNSLTRIDHNGFWSRRISFGGYNIYVSHSKPVTSKSKKWYTIIVSLALAFFIIFGSWQFFTGSFYPAGYSPGTTDNGIPNVGSFSPEHLPEGDRIAFDILRSSPGQTSVYWPGAGGFSYPWTGRSSPSVSSTLPRPEVTPNGLPYLIRSHLTQDIGPLLKWYGVTYLVVDNMSSQSLVSLFGLPQFSDVVSVLRDCNSLRVVYMDRNVAMFELRTGSAPARLINLPSAYLVGADRSALADVALGELGLTSYPVPYVIGLRLAQIDIPTTNLTLQPSAVTIIDPTLLATEALNPQVIAFDGSVNQSISLVASPGTTTQLPTPYSNWAISSWTTGSRGYANISIDSGTDLAIQSAPRSNATLSVDYLSALVNGETSGIKIDPSSPTVMRTSVEYNSARASPQSTLTINIVSSNASAINVYQNSSSPIPQSQGWHYLNYTTIVPPGASYVTARIFLGGFSGTIYLSNISIETSQPQVNMTSYSGEGLSLSNSTISLPVAASDGPSQVAILASGAGTIIVSSSLGSEVAVVARDQQGWYRFNDTNLSFPTTVKIDGAVSIFGMVTMPIWVASREGTGNVILEQSSATQLTVNVTSISGSILEWNEPYSPHWLVQTPSLSNLSPRATANGDVLFILPGGEHVIKIRLEGYTLTVVIPAVFVILNAVAAVGVAYPAFFRTLNRRRSQSQ